MNVHFQLDLGDVYLDGGYVEWTKVEKYVDFELYTKLMLLSRIVSHFQFSIQGIPLSSTMCLGQISKWLR